MRRITETDAARCFKGSQATRATLALTLTLTLALTLTLTLTLALTLTSSGMRPIAAAPQKRRSRRARGWPGGALRPPQQPYTLHPTPYTLHPTLYTLHPTPYTLHPVHPTPYTLTRRARSGTVPTTAKWASAALPHQANPSRGRLVTGQPGRGRHPSPNTSLSLSAAPADVDHSAVAPQQAPNPCRADAGAGNPAWEDVWTGCTLTTDPDPDSNPNPNPNPSSNPNPNPNPNPKPNPNPNQVHPEPGDGAGPAVPGPRDRLTLP